MPDVWVPHTVLVASRWFRIACNFIRNVVGVAFQVALDIITILFWWYVKSVYRPPGVFSETCNHTAGFGFLCCHQNKWLLGARNTSLSLVHLIVQEKVHACWINAPVPPPLLILPAYCILIFLGFGKAKEFWVQIKHSPFNGHLKKKPANYIRVFLSVSFLPPLVYSIFTITHNETDLNKRDVQQHQHLSFYQTIGRLVGNLRFPSAVEEKLRFAHRRIRCLH